jgi:ABC-type methionine transport system permease subunit
MKTITIAIWTAVIGFVIGNAVGCYLTVTDCKRAMRELSANCIENIHSVGRAARGEP